MGEREIENGYEYVYVNGKGGKGRTEREG